MPAAMESNGPAGPVRDSSRSTTDTAALSVAFHVRLALVPVASTSPPLGAVTLTAGRAVSANVAVMDLSASMDTLSGLAAPDASPLQPVKPKPVAGVAVSVTLVPKS